MKRDWLVSNSVQYTYKSTLRSFLSFLSKMITIANIKSELKRLKIKGITGKNRAALLSMLPVDHPMTSGRAKLVKPVVKPRRVVETEPVVETEASADSFKGLSVSDIRLMYNKPTTRQENSANNELRELILAEINNVPESYFEHRVYGKMWSDLKSKLHVTLSSMCAVPFDSYTILRKGGRRFNYDFEIKWYTGGRSVQTKCVEFKHNTRSLSAMPQVMSMYERVNLLDTSYTRTFYDTTLRTMIAIDPEFPVSIPDYYTYTKHLYAVTHDTHPFFSAMYSRRTATKSDLVDTSIRSYLETYRDSFNVDKFASKMKESQVNKIFLMWDLTEFHVAEFGDAVFDGLNVVRIKNGNAIVVANEHAEFHLLLRWRNGKGCSTPAWQISYYPLY